MIQAQKEKVEYGDYQTPIDLAEKICHKLIKLGISPDIIIEPTCGVGNFIKTSAQLFQSAKKIIGLEINPKYIKEIEKDDRILKDKRIQVKQEDFFAFDWLSLAIKSNENILVIGNFPWITNSQQGAIGGENLPQKTNFQNHNGLDAITGKSNFDISEWMLIRMIQWLQKREASLAMLCKTSVSRKLLTYIHSQKLNLAYSATYKVDAKKYFGATVDACLLFCQFDSHSQNYFCDVFNSLKNSNYYRIGYQNGILVKDLIAFQQFNDLYDPKGKKEWRSGIKHDCSNIMEFRKVDGVFVNGFGEIVDLEKTYLFPLIKGSDVAQNRIEISDRYVLITQKFIGEPTEKIKDLAPKTWKYLESHAKYLDIRKSKIYQNNPRFSIFGVGAYTFAPWKIAICGLYKKLAFRLVGTLDNKPAVFDDTVYFLSFDDQQAADRAFMLLTSPLATAFYSSLIFWDEKRPIKTSILNSLNLSALAQKLSMTPQISIP
jgi:hypothetical protein